MPIASWDLSADKIVIEVARLDHVGATGERLPAMVIRAVRLVAILLPIARDLQHADKGQPRL